MQKGEKGKGIRCRERKNIDKILYLNINIINYLSKGFKNVSI